MLLSIINVCTFFLAKVDEMQNSVELLLGYLKQTTR